MMYQRKLTMQELQARAPSVFTQTAAERTSDQYLHIPTSAIVDALMKNDFIPVACKQTRAIDKAHTKHVLHFSHRSLENRLEAKQELPLIRVQNSHDGKSSFQIDTGFYRLVCSNGLVMPGTKINSARIIHKVGMENDVIEASYRILDSFTRQTEEIEAMKLISLNPDERAIFAESAAGLIFEDEQRAVNKSKGISLENRLLQARRTQDTANDLWTTFNRVQENAIKGGRRVYSASGKFSAMREVKSIDREKQINVELMMLAQKMAELKSSFAA